MSYSWVLCALCVNRVWCVQLGGQAVCSSRTCVQASCGGAHSWLTLCLVLRYLISVLDLWLPDQLVTSAETISRESSSQPFLTFSQKPDGSSPSGEDQCTTVVLRSCELRATSPAAILGYGVPAILSSELWLRSLGDSDFLFTQLRGSRCVVADSRVRSRRWILSLEGSVEVRSIHSYQRTFGLMLGSFTRSGSGPRLLSGCGGYVCFCDSAVWLSPLGLLASTNPPCTFSPLGLLGIVREDEDLMTAKSDF
jgi:hypothetical protein